MDATNVKVRTLFDSERQFVIPLFQRHYVWDREEQWEPLWEDMKEKTDQRLKGQREQFTHFTGAIVIQLKQTHTDEVEKYEIIDGQQRLTTFQIILCALRDVCKSYQIDKFKDIEADADRHVRNQGSLFDSDDDQYKLVPTEFDRFAFNSLVDRRVDYSSGRIRESYDYFKDKIEGYVDLDKGKMRNLLRAILNDFGFVEITLNPGDHPERIFESLNARAKHLLQFDLLRNNLFLRARIEDDRDRLYSKYWKHFESEYWETEVSRGKTKLTLAELFFQHFLTAKLGEEDVTPFFNVYQKRLRLDNNTVEDELIELERYSVIYSEMIDCSPNSEIGRGMLIYETFGIATLRPLILFLINELKVSGTDLSTVLKIMESYTVRRLLCHKQGVRSYTKLVCKLIQKLRGKPFHLGYFIKLLSAEKAQSTKWPIDSEVKSFLKGDWYDHEIPRNVIRYILYRIELMERQENPFLETNQLIFDNKLSLEHIMPEEWKKTWCLPLPLAANGERLSNATIYYEDLFSPEYKDNDPNWKTEPSQEGLASESYLIPLLIARDRIRYLQSMGNLTLVTGKLNSKLSNSTFAKKRVALSENSILMLNKEICEHNTWDTKQIQDRTNELFVTFCKIWPSADDFAKNVPYSSNPPVDILLHDEQKSDLEKAGSVQEGSEQFYQRQDESPPSDELTADKVESDNKHQTSKSKRKGLIVTFPDGTVFSSDRNSRNQTEVWVKAILKLLEQFGVDWFMEADFETRHSGSKERIISADATFRNRDAGRRRVPSTEYKEKGIMYFITHDYGVERKKGLLDSISGALGAGLRVEVL